MSIKESFKKESSQELEKLKRMSWSDRIWYIWEYYKFHIIGIGLAAIVLWIIGNAIYAQTFTTRLSIAIINDRTPSSSSTEPLEESLKEYLNCGPKDLIQISSDLSLSQDGISSQMDYAAVTKIAAMVATHELDIMISDSSAIEAYAREDAFISLEELLPEDLYQIVQPQILEVSDSQGNLVPAALSLENTSFAQETGVTLSPPYLSVLSMSEHKEDAVAMIRYLFE